MFNWLLLLVMAPYLAYPTPDGYVIERADGADRRVIAPELVPDANAVPYWSPSGEYVALQLARPRDGLKNGVWVVHLPTNTATRVHEVNHTLDTLRWLPGDRLAVAHVQQRVMAAYHEAEALHLLLYDAAVGRIIAQRQVSRTNTDSETHITAARGGAAFHYSAVQFQGRDISGSQNQDAIDPAGLVYGANTLYLSERGVAATQFTPGLWFRWTDDVTTYTHDGAFVVVRDGAETRSPLAGDFVESYWNADQSMALLRVLAGCDVDCQWVYKLVKDDDVIDLPGTDHRLHLLSDPYRAYWSPDGRTAVFATDAGFQVLDTESVTLTPIETGPIPQEGQLSWGWSDANTVILGQGAAVFAYDLRTGKIRTLHEAPFGSLSVAMGYVGLTGIPRQIIDLETGTARGFPPHPASALSQDAVEDYRWRNGWALVFENNVMPRGLPHSVSVVRADTTGHRPLVEACLLCAHWVPDHVVLPPAEMR